MSLILLLLSTPCDGVGLSRYRLFTNFSSRFLFLCFSGLRFASGDISGVGALAKLASDSNRVSMGIMIVKGANNGGCWKG